MGRKNEHSISRDLWKFKVSKTNCNNIDKLYENCILNNDIIVNSKSLIFFKFQHKILLFNLSWLLTRYAKIKIPFEINNIPFSNFDKLSCTLIEKKLKVLDCELNKTCDLNGLDKIVYQLVTTRDLFDFLAYIFHKHIVKKDLEELFGEEFFNSDNTPYIDPKDSLSLRCSDDILLFNIDIYVYIEKNTTESIPFRIFNNEIYQNILSKYDDNKSPYENLLAIRGLLHGIDRFSFSNEFLFSFLFYTRVSFYYKKLTSSVRQCLYIISCLKTLIQKKSVKTSREYFEPQKYIELYSNIYSPFCNIKEINSNNINEFIIKSRTTIQTCKDILNNQLSAYNSLFTKLIDEYIQSAPEITRQTIELSEAEDLLHEEICLQEQLRMSKKELLECFNNNNNDVNRYLYLVEHYNKYNQNYNINKNDNIILIINNLACIDDDISNNFISIFKNKRNYPISDFPTNIVSNDDRPDYLNDFYTHDALSFDFLVELSLVYYNDLSLEEWNFLLNLPATCPEDEIFLSDFLQLIISYRGKDAYSTIYDLKDDI